MAQWQRERYPRHAAPERCSSHFPNGYRDYADWQNTGVGPGGGRLKNRRQPDPPGRSIAFCNWSCPAAACLCSLLNLDAPRLGVGMARQNQGEQAVINGGLDGLRIDVVG